MNEPSRFLPFLPNFSSFFPDFPPLFPDFWQMFHCQGWHSAPLDPPSGCATGCWHVYAIQHKGDILPIRTCGAILTCHFVYQHCHE